MRTKPPRFNGLVLALDLATTTGWASGRPEGPPEFGSVKFTGSRAQAYRQLRTWLDATWNVRDFQPDLIVYESPAVPSIMSGKTNIDTIKRLMGLAEHLEEWAEDKIELREASVSQVRAHFLGRNMKSKEAKPLTIQRCHERGWRVSGEDEADACALWDYQVSWLRPDIAVRNTPLFRRR